MEIGKLYFVETENEKHLLGRLNNSTEDVATFLSLQLSNSLDKKESDFVMVKTTVPKPFGIRGNIVSCDTNAIKYSYDYEGNPREFYDDYDTQLGKLNKLRAMVR